jgi:hypothetical protein
VVFTEVHKVIKPHSTLIREVKTHSKKKHYPYQSRSFYALQNTQSTTQEVIQMFHPTRSLRASAICALSALALSGAASIRPALADQYLKQIQSQMAIAAHAFRPYGFQFDREVFVDRLGNQGTEDLTVNLRRGEEYVIIGTCDEDCGDLDLKVYDDNGNIIASDNDTDGTPIVHLSPQWSAGFTLRAEMASCGKNPCQYGIGVLSR